MEAKKGDAKVSPQEEDLFVDSDEEFLMVENLSKGDGSSEMANTADFLSEASVADERRSQVAEENEEQGADEKEEVEEDTGEEHDEDGKLLLETIAENLEEATPDTFLEKFAAVLSDRRVAEALQDFCGEEAVTDLLVEIGRTKSLKEGVVNNMGDLLTCLGKLLNVAPQLAPLVPGSLAYFVAPPEHPTPTPPADCEPKAQEEVAEAVVHTRVLCDGCETDEEIEASKREGNREGRYIRGVRWKSAIMQDFDLCSTCERSGRFQESHGPFLKITHPRESPRELLVVLRDDAPQPKQQHRGRGHCGGGRRRRCGRNRFQRMQQQIQEQMQNMLQSQVDREGAAAVSLTCPTGDHPLTEFHSPVGFTCDVCGRTGSMHMFGCRQCNWDICKVCVDAQQPAAPAVPVAAEAPAPAPTPAPAVAPAVAPAEPAPAVVPLPKAKFVSDISIPDGSVLMPGAKFTKTWRVENPTDFVWPLDVVLVCVGGERMESQPLVLPPVAPHSTQDINLDLVAPTQPGRYVGYFRLMTQTAQHRFGHRLWVDITVPHHRFHEQLVTLTAMGFTQDQQILNLLDEEDGNLENVIPRLC